MKKILFLMSDTGGGHRAAAEAIRDALLTKYEAEIKLVDVFRSYSPFPFKYMPEFYPWLINHSKSSWGVGYKLSNSRRNARTLSRGMYVTMESGMKQMLRDNPAMSWSAYIRSSRASRCRRCCRLKNVRRSSSS